MAKPKSSPAKPAPRPAQKSDADLIAEALAAGRVTILPPGEAKGIIPWYAFDKR